jgi:hypothetical protein
MYDLGFREYAELNVKDCPTFRKTTKLSFSRWSLKIYSPPLNHVVAKTFFILLCHAVAADPSMILNTGSLKHVSSLYFRAM